MVASSARTQHQSHLSLSGSLLSLPLSWWLLLHTITVVVVVVRTADAFHTPHHVRRTFGRQQQRQRQHRRHGNDASTSLRMRDASMAYWFTAGDDVLVVQDVLKAGVNLKGRIGEVVETWEKCDVDPTCCCAEQVDLGMAVRVRFAGEDPSGSGATKNDDDPLFVVTDPTFMHYFAEDELLQQKKASVPVAETEEVTSSSTTTNDSDNPVAFDGMSCTAFKLEQLGTGRPRQIASFEPSRVVDADDK